MSKLSTLLLVAILTVSSLMVVKPANAQSIPKPSVPSFTLKFVDNSSDVPPVYGTDPYTGENIITQAAYHAVNKSIILTIVNPPSINNEAYYDIRVKGHFEENWNTVFGTLNLPQDLVIIFSSTEEGYYYNTGLHSSVVYAPSGGQVDFQVKAMIGHYSQIVDTQPPMPWSTGYLTIFVTEAESDWSETQTLTIPASTPLSTILLIAGIGVAIVVGSGLLVYFNRHKQNRKGMPERKYKLL